MDEDDESPPEMVVAFMGLTGPLGVLPSHYPNWWPTARRYKDTALWSFSIYSTRMLSLFYRAVGEISVPRGV